MSDKNVLVLCLTLEEAWMVMEAIQAKERADQGRSPATLGWVGERLMNVIKAHIESKGTTESKS